MLKNDENKRLMLRIKRSKDFYKLATRLEKEGYNVFITDKDSKGAIVNGKQTRVKTMLIGKGANNLVTCLFTDLDDSIYKQNINVIYY